jgi:MOSC domain-containing protein YiiM
MEFKELQGNFFQNGCVVAISIRPKRMEEVKELTEVNAIPAKGLEGDRYKNVGNRQVTLIQQEHLNAIASFLGKEKIDYTLTRRNILVRGINLVSLKGKNFKIGDAVLQYTGDCHPCSRMETALGLGGYNAMRGHGGITAKIISGGLIKVGDGIIAD